MILIYLNNLENIKKLVLKQLNIVKQVVLKKTRTTCLLIESNCMQITTNCHTQYYTALILQYTVLSKIIPDF